MKNTQFLEFNEFQLEFERQVDRFVESEIRPHAREWDEEDRCPIELFKRMAELDLLSVGFPEKFGGAGGITEQLILIEKMAGVSAGAALTAYVHMAMACSVLSQFGNPDQIEEYLLPALRGEKIGCFAYAEPNAGADVTAVECRARKEGDHFIVNGQKAYITNATFADFMVVVVRTKESSGIDGMSLLIIDKDVSGVSRVKMNKMGLKGSEMGEIFFDDCIVPESQLLGTLDNGMREALVMFTKGRALAAAFSNGIAGEALNQATEHVINRKSKGKALIHKQFIRFTLAEMKTRLEASRLLTYRAASLIDEGRDFGTECSIAKLHSTESCTWICERAFHLHGVQGFIMESDVQRFYRDCKVWEFGEGTNEVQKEMIASFILS